MGKKKKKALPPRRKRMKRAGRLANARLTQWVQKYAGKHIVKGYCRWYAVDKPCAVVELRLLRVDISAELEAKVRNSVKLRATQNEILRKRKQEARSEFEEFFRDYDSDFAFVAGYTSGGAAYGVTWEEYEEIGFIVDDDHRPLWLKADGSDGSQDLPFA